MPEGELTLPRAPSIGHYDLRVRLNALTGQAKARATIDTRRALPAAEARTELEARFNHADGDEGWP